MGRVTPMALGLHGRINDDRVELARCIKTNKVRPKAVGSTKLNRRGMEGYEGGSRALEQTERTQEM